MSLLELAGVDAYYGDSQALFDLSLSVGENEIVALLGRNGAGKTTTLRAITGSEVTRRDGTIRFRGTELGHRATNEISTLGVKLVPEDRRVFPTLTVEENLRMARDVAKATRPLDEMYDVFPRLADLRTSQGRNLSGGEQQMLAVARALVQDPDLLLLDEPTEGLAPVIVEDLREVFTDIVREDVTVLLTEQNVEFALDLSERAYVIETGANAWNGTIEELRDQEELLEEYLTVSATSADDR